LISSDGKILTNNHVVANERQLEVTLSDQSRYKAQLLSRDEANDLALLQITPRAKLPSVHLGDSDALQVGQKVLAIGNPFGLEGTLTTGIVSSLGRSIRGENERTLEGLIQTDAAINPGNSGGPLLDSAGNVVGINTAILGPNGGNIGIGFAMPINRAKLMLDDFQAGRKRPKLGVSVVPIAGDYADALRLPTQGGLLIQEVDADSAAARAGLRGGRQEVQIGNAEVLVGGDLIMSIDGKPVDRDDAISRALAGKRTGDTMELTIFRNGRTMNVRVRLGDEGAI
jgi:S1-C subfamily serine protease